MDGHLAIKVVDGGEAAPQLMRNLHDAGISVRNVTVSQPSLDDVFLKHTGRQIRADEASEDEAGRLLKPLLGVKRG